MTQDENSIIPNGKLKDIVSNLNEKISEHLHIDFVKVYKVLKNKLLVVFFIKNSNPYLNKSKIEICLDEDDADKIDYSVKDRFLMTWKEGIGTFKDFINNIKETYLRKIEDKNGR